MPILQNISRSLRPASKAFRPFSTSFARTQSKPHPHDNAAEWQEIQKSKSTGPHMTNTNSTIANEMPGLGADKPPPELISSVDPEFVPKDSVPENTERMTGGTQKGGPESGPNAELDVGEMEGAKFKVEPLRRTGEDGNTMRARLLCPFLYDVFPLRIQALTSFGPLQIRAAREGHSKVISSSPPSQTPTLHI